MMLWTDTSPTSDLSRPIRNRSNTVDPTTGTIRLKATLPNEQAKLWPGQFATVTLTQAGQNVGVTFAPQSSGACAASGTLTQDGRLGTVTSATGCGGAPGSIVLSSMVVGVNSLVVHFEAADPGNGCKTTGNFAGVRHR